MLADIETQRVRRALMDREKMEPGVHIKRQDSKKTDGVTL